MGGWGDPIVLDDWNVHIILFTQPLNLYHMFEFMNK